MAILKRKIIDYFRIRKKHSGASINDDEDAFDPSSVLFDQQGNWKPGTFKWAPSPDRDLEMSELTEVVQDCLKTIPQGQADVFVLSVMEELESDASCEQLSISPSNMWVRMHRASLPPVQELIKAESDEDQKVWRKRMSTILVGLMQANPGYQSLIYGKFEGDSYTEIVRVERPKGSTGVVRSTPQSRLQTRKQLSYFLKVSSKLPGELLTSLVCNSELIDDCTDVALQSAVPIYDQETEEVFGFIVATSNVYKLLEQQLSRRHTASEIVVACDTFDVMSHKLSGQIVPESRSTIVSETTPWFSPAVSHLQTSLDFIDEAASEIYGARIWFDPNVNGLMFLLKR